MTKDNPFNLPWRWKKCQVNQYLEDCSGGAVLSIKATKPEFWATSSMDDVAKEEQVLSAYIVRCCNMFPELITTLERLAGDDTEAKQLLERAKQ